MREVEEQVALVRVQERARGRHPPHPEVSADQLFRPGAG
jgi:hypothetical protein